MESTRDIKNFGEQNMEAEREPRDGVRPQDAVQVVRADQNRSDQNFRKYLVRRFHQNLEKYKRFYFEHLSEEEEKEYERIYNQLSEEKKQEIDRQIEKQTNQNHFSTNELEIIHSLSDIQIYAAVYNLRSTRLALKKILGGLSRKKNKKSETKGVTNSTIRKLFAENDDLKLTKRNERNRYVLMNIIQWQLVRLVTQSKLQEKNYVPTYVYLMQVFGKLSDADFFKKFKMII